MLRSQLLITDILARIRGLLFGYSDSSEYLIRKKRYKFQFFLGNVMVLINVAEEFVIQVAFDNF